MKQQFYLLGQFIALNICFIFLISPAAFAQMVTISGTFINPLGQGVEGAPVIVNGDLLTLSNADGSYSFEVPQGGDYTIAPFYDENTSTGVTTLDLVIIAKHILYVNPLDNPYQIIAADANGSCTLTAIDLVEIRKVILSVVDEFPFNTSWNFFDASYVFPNPEAPCANGIPQTIELLDVQSDQTGIDWMAVKMGDVQGNTTMVGISDEVDQMSPADPALLVLDEQQLKRGAYNTLELPFPEGASYGFQFELKWDPEYLELHHLEKLLEGGEYIFETDNSLKVSWYSADLLKDQGPLANLEFLAKQPGQLSDHIWLSQSTLASEFYGANLEVSPIELYFYQTGDQPILFQNYPNPAAGTTIIPFYLTIDSPVRLSIIDQNGRVIWEKKGNFGIGRHEIVVDGLRESGLFYYRLEVPNHTATKIVLLK
ncbi:MAG: T9SS type A sorting domain-containing protein [Saprospiraceae bacterium]|nr:T9SS type A sorting domain-containing protein [Saprospiraceae bacterium]